MRSQRALGAKKYILENYERVLRGPKEIFGDFWEIWKGPGSYGNQKVETSRGEGVRGYLEV